MTANAHDTRTWVPGVLALELAGGSAPARAALGQARAGELAMLLGRDLGALAPGVRDLDLVFAAAHFDPAEVLRPGWPLHRRLDELRARAPQSGRGPRIIAFGADAQDDVPQPFRADPDLAGGSLRVLPFLFVGEPAAAQAVGETLERLLLDLGMAQADTALCAQEHFDARIEHARYLTVHDLLAMTALQYRNSGLEPLWPVLETALLSPGGEATLDAPPEPLVHYVEGEARIALFAPQAWCLRYGGDEAACGEADADGARAQALLRRFEAFQARQRQFAAVLGAHGVAVLFEELDGGAS